MLLLLLSLLFYSFRVFHISVSWWSHHWGLSDCEFPQVSSSPLRILAVLNNTIIWIVSTRQPTSKSSRPFNNPLVIVPNAPFTTGTIVTFMFHSFFNSLARSRGTYPSFHFPLDLFCGPKQSRQFYRFSFFFFCWLLWGRLLAGIRWSVCMLKSHRSLCESFSRAGAGLCIYHLFVWSNWTLLAKSSWPQVSSDLQNSFQYSTWP